jgi:hypothetical protein
MGGVLSTGPEVVAIGPHAYAFAVAPNGRVYFKKFDGVAAASWVNLGGAFAIGN